MWNNYHMMADPEPWDIYPGHNVTSYSKLPIYILSILRRTLEDYDKAGCQAKITSVAKEWETSEERRLLVERLEMMKDTALVDNIICIGNGSLKYYETDSDACSQHKVACTIAEELEKLYQRAGRNLEGQIKICAQDPFYTPNDKEILQQSSQGRFVFVDDPHGFLAINEKSLVMSCFPSVTVKQIVGDLAAESSSTRPAAIFWDFPYISRLEGDVDQVAYLPPVKEYIENPESARSVAMVQDWEKVVDGSVMEYLLAPDAEFPQWTLGTRWLEICAQSHGHVEGE
ncbi:hypothetical protein P154DRAFT_604998 [Amniculicola lignicola CBS 123094]|uniref:SRR1-like domain-containing protein n=1 Tax=Amniculicola lignicola CBS 123094 TaxID=1392246 RepID=A0A6A5WJW2_9PLEO|nr:hypothetical protein P154DRAFT_604998 [Amniculicola lignicola CBS 123094]